MVTINEFIAYLQSLSEEQRAKPLHCVQLNSGSKVEELRVVTYTDNDICINDEGF